MIGSASQSGIPPTRPVPYPSETSSPAAFATLSCLRRSCRNYAKLKIELNPNTQLQTARAVQIATSAIRISDPNMITSYNPDMPTTRKRNGSTRQWRQYRAQVAPTVAAGETICPRCLMRILPGQRWSLGHRIAKAKGGTDHPNNLQPEHYECNLRGGTTPAIPETRTFAW